MEQLDKEHRKALIEKLRKADTDLRASRELIKEPHGAADRYWLQIDMWVAQQTVWLIEKALADNQIIMPS